MRAALGTLIIYLSIFAGILTFPLLSLADDPAVVSLTGRGHLQVVQTQNSQSTPQFDVDCEVVFQLNASDNVLSLPFSSVICDQGHFIWNDIPVVLQIEKDELFSEGKSVGKINSDGSINFSVKRIQSVKVTEFHSDENCQPANSEVKAYDLEHTAHYTLVPTGSGNFKVTVQYSQDSLEPVSKKEWAHCLSTTEYVLHKVVKKLEVEMVQ